MPRPIANLIACYQESVSPVSSQEVLLEFLRTSIKATANWVRGFMDCPSVTSALQRLECRCRRFALAHIVPFFAAKSEWCHEPDVNCRSYLEISSLKQYPCPLASSGALRYCGIFTHFRRTFAG